MMTRKKFKKKTHKQERFNLTVLASATPVPGLCNAAPKAYPAPMVRIDPGTNSMVATMYTTMTASIPNIGWCCTHPKNCIDVCSILLAVTESTATYATHVVSMTPKKRFKVYDDRDDGDDNDKVDGAIVVDADDENELFSCSATTEQRSSRSGGGGRITSFCIFCNGLRCGTVSSAS